MSGALGVFVLAELLLIFFVALLSAYRIFTARRRIVGARLLVLTFLALAVLALSIAANKTFSEGRQILSGSLVPPGSVLSRFLVIAVDSVLRRVLEPVFWAMFFCFSLLTAIHPQPRQRCWACLGAIALLGVLALEMQCCVLQLSDIALRTIDKYLHAGLQQFVLLSAFFAANLDGALPQGDSGREINKRALRLWCLPVLAVLVFFTIFALERVRSPAKPLIGAHYYSWFPENWAAGDVWAKLSPGVSPALGRYISDDPEVFQQQLKWAEDYGVDFFVFDWWPQRRDIDRRLREHLARWPSLGSTKFSLMYETMELRERGDEVPIKEPADIVIVTPERVERLKRHWLTLVRRYIKHPSYLRINGRPVIFVYTARHIVGDVRAAFAEARRYVAQESGEELFIVGDEAFYNVPSSEFTEQIVLRDKYIPDWSRLLAYDAVTAYNPYHAQYRELGGSKGVERWLETAQELYRRYKGFAAASGVPFWPSVIPGYNDRGVRPKLNHYIVPRGHDEASPRSFFAIALKRLGFDIADKSFPVLLVTSWNEWNEGTQIEPSTVSAPTQRDISESGRQFTEGEWFKGYGLSHLEELRQAKSAAE